MSHIEKLKEFLKVNPNDCFLKHALALEYIKLNDDVIAQQLFEENLNFNPNYVATYYHLGKLLERKAAYNEAIQIYKDGIVVAQAQNDQHSKGELNTALLLLEDEE